MSGGVWRERQAGTSRGVTACGTMRPGAPPPRREVRTPARGGCCAHIPADTVGARGGGADGFNRGGILPGTRWRRALCVCARTGPPPRAVDEIGCRVLAAAPCDRRRCTRAVGAHTPPTPPFDPAPTPGEGSQRAPWRIQRLPGSPVFSSPAISLSPGPVLLLFLNLFSLARHARPAHPATLT